MGCILTVHRLERVAALLVFFLASGALRAEYPERYVQVVVHVPPGGSTDLMARLVSSYLSRRLGAPFVVENFTGAGGEVGYHKISSAKPDGYTIGTITTTSIITHELTRKNVPYKFHDSFVPIAQIVSDPTGLFVLRDSAIRSLDDLVQRAKKAPGRINCSGTAVWGTQHVHVKQIEAACGVSLNYIPFDGVAETRNALLGGHVDLVASGVSDFDALIRARKVRALAVGAARRLPQMPDTAGTPPAIVEALNQAIRNIVADPAFLADAEKMAMKAILDYRGSADYRSELNALYKEMVHMLGRNHD